MKDIYYLNQQNLVKNSLPDVDLQLRVAGLPTVAISVKLTYSPE